MDISAFYTQKKKNALFMPICQGVFRAYLQGLITVFVV